MSPDRLKSELCQHALVSALYRVAHFIPDIMPVVSKDLDQINQMVTNTRLLLGVLTKVLKPPFRPIIWWLLLAAE